MAWREQQRDEDHDRARAGGDAAADLARDRDEVEGFGASRHWGGYGSDHETRGVVERLGDEIRSWLGDEAAKRRRMADQAGGEGPGFGER